MHGVVTLLDSKYDQAVEDLWQELELDCGLKGILVTPVAHFSWHVAVDYDIPRLRLALQEIAASSLPFPARTAGIGVFTGTPPVVYITLVKDGALLQFHNQLHQVIAPMAVQTSLHYHPQAWVPHITLAHDTDLLRMSCALDKLLFRPFQWEIPVDNLALISQAEGHIGERAFSFSFAGDSAAS
jgi:2'-5' RNA ligase